MNDRIERWTQVALLVVCAAAVSSCQAVQRGYASVFMDGATLSYEEYIAIDSERDPRFTVTEVIEVLGSPAEVYQADGVRRRLDYNSFSLTGEMKRAEFHFDPYEELIKKELW